MSREKFEELVAATKLAELVTKREEKKAKNVIVCGLTVLACVAAVAAIAYGVYCFLTPDYFEDEFEDEFDEDFFDSADEI